MTSHISGWRHMSRIIEWRHNSLTDSHSQRSQATVKQWDEWTAPINESNEAASFRWAIVNMAALYTHTKQPLLTAEKLQMTDLGPKWVTFAPNGNKTGIFQFRFSTFWLGEPKCTESELKKIPGCIPIGANLDNRPGSSMRSYSPWWSVHQRCQILSSNCARLAQHWTNIWFFKDQFEQKWAKKSFI